jgi:hypothetical protein
VKEVDMIEVVHTREGDPMEFEVVVREGKGETHHHVTMARDTFERLTAGKHAPEHCLKAAFRFRERSGALDHRRRGFSQSHGI